MKTFCKIGLSVVALITLLYATSCSKDDDGDSSNGNVTATVDGNKIKLSKAYWWIDSSNHEMHIEFYSYDPAKPSTFPGYANVMTIDYDVPQSVNTLQATTLESGDYNIYLVENITLDSDGWQGETRWNATTNSDCVITGSGSNFTIKIDRAVVYDNSGTNESKVVNFTYSGKISEMPEDLRDE